MQRLFLLSALLAPAESLQLHAGPPVVMARIAVSPAIQMQFENSLAGKMFGSVAEGLKDLAKKAGVDTEGSSGGEGAVAGSRPRAASEDDLVSDLDARAQTGELTFKDFITMSKTFAKMGNDMPGVVGELAESQLTELRDKFERHQSIVEVMLEDELEDPQLLIEDIKKGGATPGPRIQRLATASNQEESEVALFLMQFEAMRESTKRIAAGEDPDDVNECMSAPPGANRAVRRASKKKAKKAKK